MEIALNSFIVFLLLIFPGIVFRRFYYVGEFSKQFNSNNWINTFYISLIPGLIIQCLSYFAFTNLIYKKTITDKYVFINSIFTALKYNNLPKELFNFELLKWIFAYSALTIFISFILAQLCWIVVRNLDWDKKFSPLRFNNYWHYYLSGESLKFKDFEGLLENQKVLSTEADVLLDIGNEGTKLYKGFLRQHTICKNTGDLKAIYLTDVRRFRKEEPHIKDVPGHIMIIPAEKIININLTYITEKQKVINYLGIFLLILHLLAFFFLMSNQSNIVLRNTTVFGAIVGRFWLFIGWTLLITLIDSFINYKNYKEIRSARFGLLFFMAIISAIIYYWFYR